ncbi:hypothetical protein CWO84_24005 [Methylomonas sp. Kb3]|uniref:hypothetical protein n=1 Tax=Methylomonas sp. Kb3 TaxID=1611544 RepID=UPI000C3321A8|nr:hypothetical protein [Methylomonas sp. Kb3]PKD38274.1 hypothetical protein CWO84_24005 [Methylomonas sp. Kb3]
MNAITPIDFHCHGIGRFDFADPNSLVLDELENHLKIEGTAAILTLYLPKAHLTNFIEFMYEFDAGKKSGRYKHIIGIALEGPLLASFGGTPEQGCWKPTLSEWEQLARLGSHGLVYVVLSPNAEFNQKDDYPKDIIEIAKILLNHRVKPALGHFGKEDAEATAISISHICDYAEQAGMTPLFTDHLYNDMPVKCQYHWRNGIEKSKRKSITPEILKQEWTDENIEDILGPVPATLIGYAKKGILKLCLNCDGDHVDIDLCKRTIEFVGAENLMLMTDRIQSEILAGQKLTRNTANTLLYQKAGIVAGGTQSVMRQLGNLMLIGVPSRDIFQMAFATAAGALFGQDTLSLDRVESGL